MTQISCSVVLNSIFLMLSYGTPLLVAAVRAAQQLVLIPLFALVLYLLLQAVERMQKRSA